MYIEQKLDLAAHGFALIRAIIRESAALPNDNAKQQLHLAYELCDSLHNINAGDELLFKSQVVDKVFALMKKYPELETLFNYINAHKRT